MERLGPAPCVAIIDHIIVDQSGDMDHLNEGPTLHDTI